MLNIEEETLKDLLNKREDNIGHSSIPWISNTISGISMFLTLILSKNDFNLLILVAYLIAVIITAYGIYEICKHTNKKYNKNMLYNEIHSLDMKYAQTEYIVIIRNPKSRKYLLTYNPLWKCYLFPSYNEQMITNMMVDGITTEDALLAIVSDTLCLNKNVTFSKLGQLSEYKMNYSNELYTNYDFHFYILNGNYNVDIKNIKNNKFVWWSIDKMLRNKSILNKNKTVVEYIYQNTSISK